MGLFAGIVGALASGLITGISNYATSQKQAQAYSQGAKDIAKAAEEYSGKQGLNRAIQSGLEMNSNVNNATQELQASKAGNADNPMAGAYGNMQNVASGASTAGYNTGFGNANTYNTAKINEQQALTDAALKQAGIEANVGQQAIQSGLGGLQDIIKTGSEIIPSDERIKEYNNKEGLPKADVDDALRQIESIEYKYKPETGLDNEKHVGVTAQSLENTAFDDVVSENKQGIKQLDKQRLLESVMAGIASLRKELDEVEEGGN